MTDHECTMTSLDPTVPPVAYTVRSRRVICGKCGCYRFTATATFLTPTELVSDIYIVDAEGGELADFRLRHQHTVSPECVIEAVETTAALMWSAHRHARLKKEAS